MAAKSSSSARGDTGAPKRRRTTKKVAEPAPVETGVEHEETETVRSRVEEERPAPTRGSAERHDADDSGFAAGLDIPESALDFEPADDSRMEFHSREESRDDRDEGEVEPSRDEFDNRGGATSEEHDHKRRRRRRR